MEFEKLWAEKMIGNIKKNLPLTSGLEAEIDPRLAQLLGHGAPDSFLQNPQTLGILLEEIRFEITT